MSDQVQMPAETKICVGCNKEFPVNEYGYLVVPFFDVHSTTCSRCEKPFTIEYSEDGKVSYYCQGHSAGSGSQLYGYSSKYCPTCDDKRRNDRSIPCCVCQQKKGFILNTYREYKLWGGGTAIRLTCHECMKAFEAMPASHQAFYIQKRCDLAFPRGQVIYGLVDPESHLERYVGKTHDQKKRLAQHLKDRSDEPGLYGPEAKSYYSRANWMHDLHSKGLRPAMKVLHEVEVAPMVIEWEQRYILHGLQQGWQLTNSESVEESLVARAKASQLDFLRCSFESLVQEQFVREKGIQAFVRQFYRK